LITTIVIVFVFWFLLDIYIIDWDSLLLWIKNVISHHKGARMAQITDVTLALEEVLMPSSLH
jgi:hypothetical protein